MQSQPSSPAADTPLPARASPFPVVAAAPAILAAMLTIAVAVAGNRELMLAFNGHPVGPLAWWGGAWEAATLLGLGLSALLIALLFGTAQPRWLASVAWSFVTVGIGVQGVKLLLPVSRPAAVLPPELLHVFGPPLQGHNAMPSSHAATDFAVATTLLLTLPALQRRAGAVAALLAAALLVAVSRLAVGAHWPADVAAGAWLGWAGAVLAVRLADRSRLTAWLARAGAQRWLAVALMGCGIAMAFTPVVSPIAGALRNGLAASAVIVGAWRLSAGAPLAATLRWPAEAQVVRPLLLTALALLLAMAAALWLSAHVQALPTLPAWLWLAAPAGLMLSYACRAGRVHAELGGLHGASYGACLRLTLLHNAAVNLLPLRSGEAAYPLLVHRQLGVPLAEAAASLLWMRLQDLLVLGVLALLLWLPLPSPLRLLLALGLCAGMATLLRRLRRPSPIRSTGWLADLGQALMAAPRHSAQGWLYCAANWGLKLAVIGLLLAHTAGLHGSTASAGALGGELAALWPLQAPAGLGSYEAGVWLGMAATGAPVSASASFVLAALVAHGFVFATALAAAGLALLATQRPQRRLAGGVHQ